MIFSDGAMGRRRGMAAGMLAAGVTALAMAGCSSASSSSGPSASAGSLSGQTLTVYTQAPYGTQLNQYKQYYAYIASQFHKATGSTVQWVYSSSAVSLAAGARAGGGQRQRTRRLVRSGRRSTARRPRCTTSTRSPRATGTRSAGSRRSSASSSRCPAPTTARTSGSRSSRSRSCWPTTRRCSPKAGINPRRRLPGRSSSTDAQAVQKANPGASGAGFSPADPYGPWKPVWSYMEQIGRRLPQRRRERTAALTSPQLQAATEVLLRARGQLPRRPQVGPDVGVLAGDVGVPRRQDRHDDGRRLQRWRRRRPGHAGRE